MDSLSAFAMGERDDFLLVTAKNWVASYFSEDAKPSEKTAALDGFCSGANWQMRLEKNIPSANLCDILNRLTADNEKLRKALEGLLTFDRVERPVFRSKPLGVQNSTARIFQDTLIAIEDAAAQALADTE